MQKAEVAGAPESFWQDMLKQQPQELCAGYLSGFDPLGFAILVAEGYLAVVAGNNVFFLDYTAIEIAAEIDQRFLSATDTLSVHDPLLGIALWQREPRLSDGCQQLSPKHLG